MKNILFFVGFCLLFGTQGWGQPTSTQNFGTGTTSLTTGTSITLYPNPTSGTTWARIGSGAGSVNIANTSNPLNTTGSFVRAVAPTGNSVNKFSPCVNYTGGTEFYTSFKVLFGDASAGNTATSGSWSYFQGTGNMYSDGSDFTGTQVFTGIRLTYGESSSLLLSYRSGSNWVTTGLTATLFNQSTIYTFEIIGNNKLSETIYYTYNGSSYSVAADKFDLIINGTLIGDDLSKAQLSNNTNINSITFIGLNSNLNAANIFVDDVIVLNLVPSVIGNTFSGNGAWASPERWSYGNVPGSTDIAVIDGVASVNSTISIIGLTINTGKSFVINPAYSLTVSGTLTNNAGNEGLVIESDATGTGSLIHNTNTVAATVKRYYTGAAEAWHLVSSPVAAQSISDTWIPTGSYPDGSGYDFYKWSEADKLWLNQKVGANNISTFSPGTGYLTAYQAANPTKTFTGNLNNGTVNISLTKTGTETYAGSNLLGNPFPSSIDWKASSGWTRTNLAVDGSGYTMYIWNETANNYGSFNSAGTEGTNSVTQYIPPMQGFFVTASSAGTLSMDNNVRIHAGASNWLKSEGQNKHFKIKATSTANYGSDEICIEFDHELSSGGAPKWFSFVESAPSLYLPQGDKNYSIRFLTNSMDNPTVPMSFKPGINGSYQLNADYGENEFEAIYLEDLKTGIKQNLVSNPSYSFTSTTSDDPNRFKLTFASVGIENPQTENPSVYTYGNQIYVKGQGTALVELYNMSGQRIYAVQTQLTGITPIPFRASAGYYLVRIISDRNVQTSKILLNN